MSLLSPRLSRRFSTRANGGEKDELTHEVREDATIERVDVRFYRGPRLDLELRPFMEASDGNRVSIVDLVGRDVIVGDGDHFSFPVSESVEKGDVIGVEYENTDATHGYDFNVDVVLERAGGVNRIIDLAKGVL